MSVFPVLHYLPEFAQTHVHRLSDFIYLTLCRPLYFLLSVFLLIRVLFQSGGQSIGTSAPASALLVNNQG